MEDSESVEKQENPGIGPASACRGESAFTRVFHAPWHAQRVLSAAPERFSALRPPLDSGLVKQNQITPRATARPKRKAIEQNGAIRAELTCDASCAGLTRASIFFAKCFYEDGWIAGSS